MILSACGKYAVVSGSEARAAGVTSIKKTPSRCLCGGRNPESRAAMELSNPKWSTQYRDIGSPCHVMGHEQYCVVDLAEWPVKTYKVDLSGWDLPTPTVAKGPKKIPDWPLPCPSCKRPDSAVLLFMGYDCKHGCYK